MSDFTSQGNFGLSHFRNSRASQSLFEPAYNNIFTLQIALPVGVGSTDENTNLLLENVIKVTGLQSHTYPTTLITQNYKYAQRRFIGAKPEKTTMDIGLDFEVNLDSNNSAYVLKTLRKWCDLAYDPLTGRTGLKADYTSPWALITVYNRVMVPYHQWKLYYVFPMSQITPFEPEYLSDGFYRITGFQLACDDWDETII
jgi:hypothetical protein